MKIAYKRSEKSRRAKKKAEEKPTSTRRKPRSAPASGSWKTRAAITVASRTLPSSELTNQEYLFQIASPWMQVFRQRQRWKEAGKASESLGERAQTDLREAGFDLDSLQELAWSDHVQVSLPYDGSDDEIAGLPWEAFLSNATRELRAGRVSLITRHMLNAPAFQPRPPERALIITSAPGELSDDYDFAAECRLIQSILKRTAVQVEHLIDPTIEQIEEKVSSLQPDLIHFTGIDVHEGRELLGDESLEEVWDGMYVAGNGGIAIPCGATQLAQALVCEEHPAALVTLTGFNTAAHVAASVTRCGAGAAIGFQDFFDNAVGELFYATLYRAYLLSDFDVLAAFRAAWLGVRESATGLRGSGVVLWSASDLLREERKEPSKELEQERRQDFEITEAHRKNLDELLEINVEPEEGLNYSVLHNNGALFRSFRIRKLVPGRIRGLRVQVSLYVGSTRFPYDASFDVEQPSLDLVDEVRIPLTWALGRSIVETIRTNLFVQIALDDAVLLCRTYSVLLLPPNEWRDNERDGPWLPSFVLPRDPAVEDIVSRARGYLRVLADDHGIGFDGYQSVDPNADDPGESVDLQVRALWSVLAYDLGLGYINPPPAYTESSQRLRTPTDVVRSATGTCIDLVLLIASCLEYVEIYPTLILMDGHAFVGYWRTAESYERYVGMKNVFGAQDPGSEEPNPTRETKPPHVTTPESYDELVALVEDDDLVPLEAVALTRREGFAVGFEQGVENLLDSEGFHSLLDVYKARLEVGVTPLPLREPEG